MAKITSVIFLFLFVSGFQPAFGQDAGKIQASVPSPGIVNAGETITFQTIILNEGKTSWNTGAYSVGIDIYDTQNTLKVSIEVSYAGPLVIPGDSALFLIPFSVPEDLSGRYQYKVRLVYRYQTLAASNFYNFVVLAKPQAVKASGAPPGTGKDFYLKDGRVVSGEIVSFDADDFIVKTAEGETAIKGENIDRIENSGRKAGEGQKKIASGGILIIKGPTIGAGIGTSGVYLKLFSTSPLSLEGRCYFFEKDIIKFGPRLYANFNPNKTISLSMGVEYNYVVPTAPELSGDGSLLYGFASVEWRMFRNYSLCFDCGVAGWLQEISGLERSDYLYNIGMYFYF